MIATEVQIGDWVHHTKDGDTFQVREITLDEDNRTFIGTNDWSSNGKYIEPIPLTEEILKANAVLFEGDEWKSKWDGCFDSEYDPKYVHELQHALRLCGLHELADNLQIK